MTYTGTLQAEALALVAAKMRSALMIEGELPADGLAALEGDHQDLFLTLARRLSEQGAEDASLETLFAQTRAIEAGAGDDLIDGAWDAPPPLPSEQSGTVDQGAGASLIPVPGELSGSVAAEDSRPGASGQWLSLGELARSIRRPKARRRPVPEGQLTLFRE